MAAMKLRDGELEEMSSAEAEDLLAFRIGLPMRGLAGVKAELKAAVDAMAERERLKYITGGAGQAMTYQAKADEARRLVGDVDPQPSAYPLLTAEVGITAATLAEVGAVVLGAFQQWLAIGAAIEAARLAAKRAIDDAGDEAAARAVAPDWPVL